MKLFGTTTMHEAYCTLPCRRRNRNNEQARFKPIWYLTPPTVRHVLLDWLAPVLQYRAGQPFPLSAVLAPGVDTCPIHYQPLLHIEGDLHHKQMSHHVLHDQLCTTCPILFVAAGSNHPLAHHPNDAQDKRTTVESVHL